MPNRPNKPCAQPACPALVPPQHRFCPTHRSQFTKARDKRRRDTGPYREYSSPAYRALRPVVLEEEPVCHWCKLEGVPNPKPSTDADHVVPLARGGLTTRGNLVGSCQRHNRGRR